MSRSDYMNYIFSQKKPESQLIFQPRLPAIFMEQFRTVSFVCFKDYQKLAFFCEKCVAVKPVHRLQYHQDV